MPTTQNPHISASVFHWYNQRFNNTTYRQFHDALEACTSDGSPSPWQTKAAFIDCAMDLLVDAALARSRADYYKGAEEELLHHIRQLDSCVTTLAMRHLDNFGAPCNTDLADTGFAMVINDLNTARADLSGLYHRVRQTPDWQARAARRCIDGAVMLLGASADLLTDVQHGSTIGAAGAIEKLNVALIDLQHGHEALAQQDKVVPSGVQDCF